MPVFQFPLIRYVPLFESAFNVREYRRTADGTGGNRLATMLMPKWV